MEPSCLFGKPAEESVPEWFNEVEKYLAAHINFVVMPSQNDDEVILPHTLRPRLAKMHHISSSNVRKCPDAPVPDRKSKPVFKTKTMKIHPFGTPAQYFMQKNKKV